MQPEFRFDDIEVIATQPGLKHISQLCFGKRSPHSRAFLPLARCLFSGLGHHEGRDAPDPHLDGAVLSTQVSPGGLLV